MRGISSLLEALAGVAAIVAMVAIAPMLTRAARDVWVLVNALAQPGR